MAKTKEAVTQSAVEEYRQAVAANPKSAEAYANLGWGLYGEDKWDEAVKAFTEALSLEAGNVDALYGLALTHKIAGAKTEAVTTFNATLAQLPKLEDQMRGNVLKRLAHGHINLIQSGDWKLSSVLGNEA
jgi:Tfp pilus assembly protein PilF